MIFILLALFVIKTNEITNVEICSDIKNKYCENLIKQNEENKKQIKLAQINLVKDFLK